MANDLFGISVMISFIISPMNPTYDKNLYKKIENKIVYVSFSNIYNNMAELQTTRKTYNNFLGVSCCLLPISINGMITSCGKTQYVFRGMFIGSLITIITSLVLRRKQPYNNMHTHISQPMYLCM